MSKTQKELAFLRDLSVEPEWTARFTETFDKSYEFTDEESVLYVNAGAGNHVLALREKLKDEVEIFGVTENEELTQIAQAKAKAVKADVGFSSLIPPEHFDLVIADASFVPPDQLPVFLKETVGLAENRVVFFLPTRGSFGEVFSMLWEVCLSEDLIERSGAVEDLITGIPTVSEVEEMAQSAGLKQLKSNTTIEVFEFEDGEEFVNSVLVADFLLPVWFGFLRQEEKEEVRKKLSRTIDENRDSLSFRFTVKATIFGGKKGLKVKGFKSEKV
ncbi:MAG: hypothetical protein R2747_02115 [Pyrinomonadaceae bacterium]